MKYVALLRGINVGGNNRVDMKKLKAVFESLSCSNVSTYINSGNVIFETTESYDAICQKLKALFKKEFGFEIPTLVKSATEMAQIAKAIPSNWKNDTEQRTDVAYLFPEIDSKKTIEDLPLNKEFVNIRYVKGALIWNIDRKNYAKSRLNKLIGHKLYKFMTMRNVNTARYLGNMTSNSF